jgi:endonuclease III
VLVSKKTEAVQKLLKKITPRAPLPRPLKEGSLLEQGLLVVLVRHLSQSEAEATLNKLRKLYPDWNELRVAQAQEIAGMIATGERRAPREACEPYLPVTRDVREYLQEVFQKTHGFDLEFLKDDITAASKLVTQMPFLGLAGGSFLLWLSTGKQLPVHQALVRVLDRLGLITRSASMKKARDVIEPLVPEGEDLTFVTAFGEVADRWCWPQKPICQECPLVEDCPYGRKAFQDWKVQQARLEAQRQKEQARKLLIEKKEAAKRARDDARDKKKAEAEAKKVAREKERVAKLDAKRKAEEDRLRKANEAHKKAAAPQAGSKKAAVESGRKSAPAKAAKKPAKKSAPKPKPKSAPKKSSKPAAKPKAKSGKKR